jgi:protein ImuB
MADRNHMVEGALMYAILHTPDFPVQAAARQHLELRKRSFVLLDGEPPSETVYAANKPARALGIEVGMSKLQAQSVPGITAIPRMRELEESAHTILHETVCYFSPRIEAVETHPETFALDTCCFCLCAGRCQPAHATL